MSSTTIHVLGYIPNTYYNWKNKTKQFLRTNSIFGPTSSWKNPNFPLGKVTWGEIKALRDVPSRFDEVCQASGWPILINVEFGLSALLALGTKPWQWVFPFKHGFQLYAPLSAISHAVHHFHKPILMTAPWVKPRGVWTLCDQFHPVLWGSRSNRRWNSRVLRRVKQKLPRKWSFLEQKSI